MPKEAVGTLVREWRDRRHRSQLDLAIEIGVSARHLSFVETGRAKPSPELVVALAEGLDVPLRERNTMLLAAGYAPRYGETSLSDPAMAMMHSAIQRLLDAHDPYPGLVIDRHWNVVLSNTAATTLVAALPPDLLGPPINVYRVVPPPAGSGRAHPELPRVGELPPAPAASIGGAHERSNPRRAAGRGDCLSERRRAEPRATRRGMGRAAVARSRGPRARGRGAVSVHDAHHVRHAARHHAR